MGKMKMRKMTLIPDKYVPDKFRKVDCYPLRAPVVSMKCQIELDVNNNGAAELMETAREDVKKYLDDRVGLIVKKLPQLAEKVERIGLEFSQKLPPDMSEEDAYKKFDAVIEKQTKAHNTIIAKDLKLIESGVSDVVESARKKVAKRKSAIKNMKIKTIVKVVMVVGLTVTVTGAVLVGAVVATVATGGVAAIVIAAVGASIAALSTIVGAAITIAVAMKNAGGSADQALSALKKSMDAVAKHQLYVQMNTLPKDQRDGAWKKIVRKRLSSDFQALEVKVANYESHINMAIAAGSKASMQIDKLLYQVQKLPQKINEAEKNIEEVKKKITEAKKKGASNKKTAKDLKKKEDELEKKMKEVEELKNRRIRLEEAAKGALKLNESNMKTLDQYKKSAEEIGEIVRAYKDDTPPILQQANKILATIKEVTPGLNDFLKLVAATGKTTSGMKKIAS